jgi:TPR repeat protein
MNIRKLKIKYLNLLGYKDDVSIGRCFHNGIHVKQNNSIAFQFYSNAAKAGSPEGFKGISMLLMQQGRNDESFYYQGLMHELLVDWENSVISYKKSIDLWTCPY